MPMKNREMKIATIELVELINGARLHPGKVDGDGSSSAFQIR